MDYSTLTQPPVGMGGTEALAQTTKNSLYEVLQGIPDPRRKAGKRYPLPVLICLLCLAKMAGQPTLKGATKWVRLRAEHLSSAFGLKRRAMPCQMTYKRILEVIDAQILNDLLAAFFTRWEAQQRCEDEPSRLQTEAGFLPGTDHAPAQIWQTTPPNRLWAQQPFFDASSSSAHVRTQPGSLGHRESSALEA
jgi:hypothetical protein